MIALNLGETRDVAILKFCPHGSTKTMLSIWWQKSLIGIFR